MCEAKFASHDARQKRCQEKAERTNVREIQGPIHRLVGTSLWVSRERNGVLTVWVEVGDRLLRCYTLGEERA